MKKILQTLQGSAGHHRDSRYRRVERRSEAHRRPRPQDPALPVAAVPRGRAVHRHAGTLRQDRRHGEGLQGNLEGKYDDIPEQAFYMKGPIEEVLEAAEKMKAAA